MHFKTNCDYPLSSCLYLAKCCTLKVVSLCSNIRSVKLSLFGQSMLIITFRLIIIVVHQMKN
uniref:Putative ovule protein n=1 Tax=Solanum chacoense TaxID=4108 RepID=A0A0V0GW82_SOLCH